MNGDLLTDFNYCQFWNAHQEAEVSVSVGVYFKEVPVSLGVLELGKDDQVIGFREKPVLSFPCSMGIYVLEPDVLRLIPAKGVFGFDDLMAVCLGKRIGVRAHPFGGLWLDIGRPEDYDGAAPTVPRAPGAAFPQGHPEWNGIAARRPLAAGLARED